MRYLIHSDISYLYNKRKFILSVILFIPLIICSIYSSGHVSVVDIIINSLGLNLNIQSINIIELLMLLFNIFSFLYLISDIYIKDLDDNLENIFLRVKPIKYITLKNISFIFVTIILKGIQYILILLFLLIFKNISINVGVLKLFITDIVYILFLEYSFLLIYLSYILTKKNILVLLSLLMALLIIYPKNVCSTSKYTILMIPLILLINIVIGLLFYKRPQNIIESI